MPTVELGDGREFDVYEMNEELDVVYQTRGGNCLGMRQKKENGRKIWFSRGECGEGDVQIDDNSPHRRFLDNLCKIAEI